MDDRLVRRPLDQEVPDQPVTGAKPEETSNLNNLGYVAQIVCLNKAGVFKEVL